MEYYKEERKKKIERKKERKSETGDYGKLSKHLICVNASCLYFSLHKNEIIFLYDTDLHLEMLFHN